MMKKLMSLKSFCREVDKETYREIGSMLSDMKRPSFAVLEGGYSRDLPECVHMFLTGFGA